MPTYKVKQSETFNDENGRFTAEVWLKEELLGVGKGDTKKASQQAAAQQAYNSIMNNY